MQERIKLGIGMLGAGWMGRAHSHAYETARHMYWPVSNWEPELVAIGDITQELGEEAARRYRYAHGVAGYEPILANPDVDIFDNVTPDPMHMAPTIAAAQAGKHVVCEKPLSVGRENAGKMLQAVQEVGVKHLCCFCYRFQPAVRLAYELIRAGALGKIYHFSGRYFQDSGHDPQLSAEKTWYAYSGVGQGTGTHVLDMLRFLVGEVQSLTGRCYTYNKIRPSEKGPVEVSGDEGFFAMLDVEGGASASIEVLGIATGKRSQFTFEIYGSEGSLWWDVQEPNFLHVFLEKPVARGVVGYNKVVATEPGHPFMDVWWPAGHTLGWEHGHVNMLAHFMDCVANDKPVAPLGATFEDGYKAAVLVDAIKESWQKEARLEVKF